MQVFLIFHSKRRAVARCFHNAGTWAAIPLGSFLLFLIQPLIGKALLPIFGGTSAVWTVCLLFFQLALLLGYWYAHLLSALRRPGTVHLALLFAAVWISRGPLQLPQVTNGGSAPEWELLRTLAINIGLPYVTLAAGSPLLQSWYAARNPGKEAYRLFALSNAASIAGLLFFPLLLEPQLALPELWSIWQALFVVYAAAAACDAVVTACHALPAAAAAAESAGGRHPRIMWLALSGAGVMLLMAISNHLTTDVAPVPFLWILPLLIYLFTFILTFESERWYSRRFYFPAALVCILLFSEGTVVGPAVPLWLSVAVSSITLFTLCMAAHGELVRIKPPQRELPRFYLYLAGGGALGGLTVAILLPRIFPTLIELPLAFLLLFATILAATRKERTSPFLQKVWSYALLLWIGLVPALTIRDLLIYNRATSQERNFYGITRVVDSKGGAADDSRRVLYHGAIIHGVQYLSAAKRKLPTEYYAQNSGVGVFLRSRPDGVAKKVGILGLGAGTLATYSRPEDQFVFYEINPAIIGYAQSHFSFLDDAAARIEIVPGDARISLAAQAPQRFDVLILDVFNGDAIPLHLFTVEAFELYLSHLTEDGWILLHLTNEHLELMPIAERFAAHFGLAIKAITSQPAEGGVSAASDWAVLRRGGAQPRAGIKGLWRDDFSNLWEAVKW